MDFDAWTNRAIDHERRRRLMYGYVIGILSMGTFGTAMALTAQDKPASDGPEEDVMALQLAEEPEPEPEPEPEVEPEPAEPPPPQEMVQPSGPVLPTLEVPTEIPEDSPTEEAPTKDDFNPYASGDPYQFATQGTVRRAPAVTQKVVKATPVAAAPSAPAGPTRMTADTTPPKVLASVPAQYPAAAKAAGIQGNVVVSFVVGVDGIPTNIQAVRGPEALRPACEAVVRGTRYSPALRDGQPVSLKKNKVCRFKLN